MSMQADSTKALAMGVAMGIEEGKYEGEIIYWI